MDAFSKVEDLGPVENVRVVHRRLRIPKADYYRQMVAYDGDGFEEQAQLFVRDYIRWKKEEPGLIGMVRGWEEGDWVVLDATLRYTRQPSEG